MLEDVLGYNEYGFPLRPPSHPCYLHTEFVGQFDGEAEFHRYYRKFWGH